ncbi:MAG: hypothetical protein R3Y23_06000 [Bacillota bacterium]
MFKHSLGNCFLGRTLVLTTAQIELEVTLDVGPRIISLKKLGSENILFQDINDSVNNDCSAVYGAGAKWHIYGGHRVWLSPEDASTYYPDNSACSYSIANNSVTFTPNQWAVVDVQPRLTIEFLAADKLQVKMQIENKAQTAKQLCVWGLTVMRVGGTLTIPLSTEDTGYLANRNLVLWSYDDIKDSRFTLHNDRIVMTSNKDIAAPFKLGCYNKDIRAEYVLGDTTFIKTFFGEDGASYPDYNCNIEAYMSNFIHEVESLSPIKCVDSGATITHNEIWKIK